MSSDQEPRMEVRALLAIVLSMIVLTLYQYFFVPPPVDEAPELPPAAESLRPSDEAAPPAQPDSQAAGAEAGPDTPGAEIAASSARELVVRGNDYEVRLSNVGGRLSSFVLTEYADADGSELDLVHPLASSLDELPLQVLVPDAPESADELNSALYEMTATGGRESAGARTATADSPVVVTMRWASGGRSALKQLTFGDRSGRIGVEASIATGSDDTAYLAVGPGLDSVEGASQNVFLAEQASAMAPDGHTTWAASDVFEQAAETRASPWLAVESYYFMAAFVVEEPRRARIEAREAELEGGETKQLVVAAVRVPGDGLRASLYLGPKKYDRLVAEGDRLSEAIDFGMFGIIARPLLVLLVWIHGFVGNYGVAIILLTVALRLALWPLNQKAMMSMRRTQRLQPQMAAIRNKYKNAKDMEQRQKMNEEVMALYKKEGVSPFGGCLPMLAQMPLLFAFYRLLSVSVELRQAPFTLWVEDLSQHDPYLVLPLLMGGSMLVQQRMTPVSGVQPSQARMMQMMPIIFTVMFLYVPSGLVLYWLVNNVLGIGQQLYVNRAMEAETQQTKAPKKKGKKGQRGKK